MEKHLLAPGGCPQSCQPIGVAVAAYYCLKRRFIDFDCSLPSGVFYFHVEMENKIMCEKGISFISRVQLPLRSRKMPQSGKGLCSNHGTILVFSDWTSLLKRLRWRRWKHVRVESRGSHNSLSVGHVKKSCTASFCARVGLNDAQVARYNEKGKKGGRVLRGPSSKIFSFLCYVPASLLCLGSLTLYLYTG